MADEEHYLECWRYEGPIAGWEANEPAITTGWLPTAPGGWANVTFDLKGPVNFQMSESTRSLRAEIIISNEDRLVWREDGPVAFVHSYWDGSVTSARTTLMWGYLSGEGDQSLEETYATTSRRTVSYADRWARRPTPSKVFGRPNLLLKATFDAAKSVAPLADPAEEVKFREYVSQAVVDGTMGNDDNADTCVVSDLIAELAPAYALGNTVVNTVSGWRPCPRIVRCYAGRTSHTIGAGGQPVFIELTCHADHLGWGSFDNPAAVPAFYEQDAGSPYPATISNSFIGTAFDPGGRNPGGYFFRCRLKNQQFSAHPENGPYVQWNTSSTWYNLPAKMTFYIRSGDNVPSSPNYSVGRTIHVTMKQASPEENGKDEIDIVLTDNWVRYTLDLDSMGKYGGVMMRFGAKVNGVANSDLVFELDDLRVTVGYNDFEHAKWCDSARYSICFDDGIGHERWINLYNDTFLPNEWTIPPEGSLIICDDANIFTSMFKPGDRQVVGLRPRTVDFWFGPTSAARLKAGHTTNPPRFEYDTSTGVAEIVEEIIFSGLGWAIGANPQAIVRQNPTSTGGFTTEDYPRLGIDTLESFGSSYWTYNLGAYNAPTLLFELSATGLKATVSNETEYENAGVVAIDDELMTYTFNDMGVLTLSQRGYNPLGAPFGVGHPNGPAVHAEGAKVTPWRNGAPQVGNLVQYVAIRRRVGLARILDGKILYSNDPSPPSPSPDYERTAGGYWKVLGFFSNGQSGTVNIWPSLVGYVEARWLCIIVAHMEPWFGYTQRGKFNEAIARQYLPYGGNGGSYQGVISTTLSYMVGHFLVTHALVPPSKYDPGDVDVILDSVSFAPNTVAQVIESAAKAAGFTVVVDAYGYCRLVPRPASPYFVAPDVSQTWTAANVRGYPTVKWKSSKQVSQVKIIAREYAQQRIHAIRYPQIAGTLGIRHEAKDIAVSSPEQARDYAKMLYRQLNAQRTPPVITGWVPGLKLFDRHVFDFPEIDGQVVGVNCYVTGYKITFERVQHGSWRCRTQIDLDEMIL